MLSSSNTPRKTWSCFVERLSNSHLQVIARRTDLSPEVSDAIAEKGDRPVHRILAGNREIKLSRETMLSFVKYATEDVVLREDLCLRSDLSPAVCRALLPLVDDETKKRLRSIIEGSLSQDQLDQIARLKVLRREFGDALNNPDMTLLWREAERAEITVNELMILLLQDGRFNHAIELLSARGRTAQTALKDAVFNGKKDLVLRTAEKAGLDTPTFALFAKVRCDHLKIPATQGSEWTATYKKFLDSTAQTKQSRCGDFQANRRERNQDPRVIVPDVSRQCSDNASVASRQPTHRRATLSALFLARVFREFSFWNKASRRLPSTGSRPRRTRGPAKWRLPPVRLSWRQKAPAPPA